jgi:tripartite-type tricarboxylate transporter receptor subunit TctC
MFRIERARLQIKWWMSALLCAALIPAAALAQTYPNKPIRIIVPFAAGGAVDVVARAVGQRMS